jgi:hypothetical protein
MMLPFGVKNTLSPKSSSIMSSISGKELGKGFENPTEEGHP